ncbi:MAG TPA: SDR family oxidoreductase [Acidimicrobiales bacterium]|nr:SDR family oxidoreductase [Acidimicrobiales bacterium]
MDLELTGRRAVVTGGSRGIGKAVALALCREGVDVALFARDQTRLDAAAREISQLTGRRVEGFAVDTGSEPSVIEGVHNMVQSFGGVEILVNAAAKPGGQSVPPTYDQVTTEAFFEDMNVKVMGYLRCAQQVAPHMINAGWGRIINISGLAARQAGTVIGSVRNVAVSALTKNLADALGPYNINVTVVHPATTVTEATTPEMLSRPATNVIGRMITASEVADVVTFLASPKSIAITGDAIAVGGGVPRSIYY